jgi:hypothetical protein
MRARGKFSLLDRVFRVPFLDGNDDASAIISSSVERFRLALALPGGRARIGGLWRPRPRRGHEAVPVTAVARRRGARFSEQSGVIRAKRGQVRPIGCETLSGVARRDELGV